MTDFYSVTDTSKLFGVPEARLRYWIQTGIITASVRRSGKYLFSSADLVQARTAAELFDARVSPATIREYLETLRQQVSELKNHDVLRVCYDGDKLEVLPASSCETTSSKLVFAFSTDTLVAKVAAPAQNDNAVPKVVTDEAQTGVVATPSAYRFFRDGVDAENVGDLARAEECFRRAIELEPSLAAAHTNLGSLLYSQGKTRSARICFETALNYEPGQAEARYNLAMLLDDLGDTEGAITTLKRVCTHSPDFADAHYNLGLMLARVGGLTQAKSYLRRYLELDPDSEWASRSRSFLAGLA